MTSDQDVRPRPAPAPDPGMPRDILVLSLVAFIVALGFGVVGPAPPLLADGFGVGKAAAATAVSAFALLRFVSALANGRLVDRLGARRVLAAGLLLQAVTTFAAGLAPDFVWVVVLRGLSGLGSAAFTVAAMSLIIQTAPPDRRGRATSRFQGGFLFGAVIGPAFGGVLTDLSPRVPFLVYGVFSAVAGVVGVAMLSRAPRPRPGPEVGTEALLAEHADEGGPAGLPGDPRLDHAQPVPGGGRRRAIVAALAASLGIGWVLYGVRTSLMPIYVVEELQRPATWAGMAFLVGSLAQALVLLRAGKLVDTWGRRPALLLGATGATAAVLALVLPPHLGVFLVSMALLGASAAFLGSAPAAVLGDVSGGRPGRLVAGFQMASDGGAVVGPLVAGLLADHVGYGPAFASGAVVLAVAAVAALLMPETGPRREAGAP